MGNNENTEGVSNCFNGYKTAVLSQNGAEAIKFVDAQTLNYYAQMLDYSISISSSELQKKSFLDKLMILTLRHRATPEELHSFNGETLFIWAVENGMVGKESVQNASIGKIEIEDQSAKGQFVNNGQSTPFYYKFVKTGESWKIDLTSMFDISEKALLQMVKQQGMEQQEFIYYMLELLTGKEVDPNIWYMLPEK
jgi:hypothetical protein